MNSQIPTARLVKSIRRNETVRVSSVIKQNEEFTKSPQETLKYMLDILSPGEPADRKSCNRVRFSRQSIHET